MNRRRHHQGGAGGFVILALLVAAAALSAGGPTATGAAQAAPAGEWTSRLPEAGQPWAAAIEQTGAAYDVDPRLLAALVWQESAFNPDARSPAGALGLTQLMPGTAAELGVDPYDPEQNLNGGARYLRMQLDWFGDVDLALAAYNAGPGEVIDAGGVPPIAQTRDYVIAVLAYYDGLQP